MMGSTIFGAIGLMLPASAWLIINQDWSFDIPLIGIVFKPWRLFVLYLGLPSLIGAIALMFCPETPKFVYSAVGYYIPLNSLFLPFTKNSRGMKKKP
jgi:hypothetical protein